MKKNFLICLILILSQMPSFGQDSTAAINNTWAVYARDTNKSLEL